MPDKLINEERANALKCYQKKVKKQEKAKKRVDCAERGI